MKKTVLFFAMVLLGSLPVAQTVLAEGPTDQEAKQCAVEANHMRVAFEALSGYLKAGDITDVGAQQVLDGAGDALRRAREACATTPEMTLDLNGLAYDLALIEDSLRFAQ